VHNDYQRHLPYLWAAPRFELSKFHAYARGQAANGHIDEYLGSFGLGPVDAAGGRVMADTTTLFVVEAYEFYINTGDLEFLHDLYPAVKSAMAWLVERAKGVGLPQHLVCTYDILALERYPTTTYNAMLHLLAMRAGAELAAAVGDADTGAAAGAAFTRGQAATEALLWNSSGAYLRAYSGAVHDAVMSDALYGQVIASHHGLGLLYNASALRAHLAAELRVTATPWGLTTLVGRRAKPAPPAFDSQDDAIWLQAAPDNSAAALRLAREAAGAGAPLAPAAVAAALEPARWQLANQRDRLADLWNYRGLNSGGAWGGPLSDPTQGGYPYLVRCGSTFAPALRACAPSHPAHRPCAQTDHYGFTMVDFYLLGALTGQRTNVAAGLLSFDPVYACPFSLPVLLQGVEGTLSCGADGAQHTLALAFGRLALPAGGVSVAGRACAAAVRLGPGESVTW